MRDKNRLVVIGGVENAYRSLETLVNTGEEIASFYTRDELTPGWGGIAPIDETKYSFLKDVPIVRVRGSINDYAEELKSHDADYIYSLGWTKIYKKNFLKAGKFIGVHQSLLPRGVGICPIANAILHDLEETGITFFWVTPKIDAGGIIAQAKCTYSPQTATSTEIYQETMVLEKEILEGFVIPLSRKDSLPNIPQDKKIRKEFRFPKGITIDYSKFPEDRVIRARTYPYE